MVTSNMDNQAEKNGKVGYNLNLLVPKKPKSTVGSDSSDEDKEGRQLYLIFSWLRPFDIRQIARANQGRKGVPSSTTSLHPS